MEHYISFHNGVFFTVQDFKLLAFDSRQGSKSCQSFISCTLKVGHQEIPDYYSSCSPPPSLNIDITPTDKLWIFILIM
jgi:hypothetical protein